MAESGEPESHAARGTVCPPDSPPGPCRVHSPYWRKAVGLDPNTLRMPLAFGARVRPAHFTFQCWQRLSESNAHDPCGSSSGSSRLSTPHASLWIGGERTTRRPCREHGTHRLATACRTLPASLSVIGARLRTCTSHLPLTRRAHRFLCVTGKFGGPPRNRTWITPLKRRVSVSLS